MHREIELRKTVMVALDLNTTANRDSNITFDLGFPADEVVVRSVTYNTTEAGNLRNYQVFSDLIDDQYLCAFPALTSTSQLDNTFPLRGFQKGARKVQIQEIAGGVTTNAIGNLMMFLEFRKYKKEPKPKKE
jgi:hypothetical protein